ncbi:MAG: hypothetical protein AB1403_10380 [Candidatus Riflebacteria bacterium]
MSSPEHGFEVNWSDPWTRVEISAEGASTLYLKTPDGNGIFQIIVVEDVSKGEEFLRSEAAVAGIYQSLQMQKVLFDEMGKMGSLPSRKVMFQAKGILCGLEQTITNRKLYMLNMVQKNARFPQFKAEFEKLTKGFRFAEGKVPEKPAKTGSPSAGSDNSQSTSGNNDFGSDF